MFFVLSTKTLLFLRLHNEVQTYKKKCIPM